MVTQGLSPQKLWHFFEALCAIPRASGNEGEVIRYLKRFAREHDVEYSVDEAGNIVMRRPAEKRQGGKPVVVVQSHVDMVCEKNDSTHHDFDRDPIQLKREGEWLRAEHTSLGADNGIGVAAMLALLADPLTEPWPIEYLFTVEEEIGLNGARALDAAMIQGNMLINLDTEEVGTLYIGCAGGRDSDLIFPMSMDPRDRDLDYFSVEVGGLRGGHSGAEIHLGSANAIKLLARILKNLQESLDTRLVSIHGGDKDNAIPREACAVIGLSRGDVHRAREIYDRVTTEMRGSMVTVDPGLTFHMNPQPNGRRSFDMQTSSRLIDALMVIPHGVLSMSSVMEDLVETSNNLSSIRTDGEEVRVHASHRSSVAHALSWVAEMHRSIARLSGAAIEQDEGYPGWNPDPESRLLGYAFDAVEKVSGKPPSVKAIHAGLECGVIKEKVEGMDAVSMGPTIVGPHSPDERVHVGSVKTFWNILVQTLTLIYSDRR